MSRIIHIDFETFSEADLKKVGAFRYAADESTEIIMAAVQLDSGEPAIWIHPDHENEEVWSDPRALEIMQLWEDESVEVYAHNAGFEHAVSRYQMEKCIGIKPPKLHQWRCTMVMALRAALPGQLEKCAKELGLEQQKDTRGKALIRMFSMPQNRTKKGGKYQTRNRNLPQDFPGEFAEFADYCKQDVRTEAAIHKCLKAFELTAGPLQTFQLDIRMNHQGIPINVEGLKKAQIMIDEIDEELFAKFSKLTGGLAPTQREKVLKLLQGEGFPLDGLRSSEIAEFFKSDGYKAMSPFGQEVLQIRYDLGYAAVKKVAAMLNCDCGDGFVRGTLQYHGASTGRWSGRLIQPHNFKRPTIKDTAGAYEMICQGATRDEIELVYGNPYEVISSCIRHFVQPHEGMILDADYSSIEARLVCWLADDKDGIQEYVDRVGVYERMGSLIFDVPYDELVADQMKDIFRIERFVGKQAVLGCGYGMGIDKFIDTCESYGQKIDYETGEKAVKTFREVRNPIVKLWYLCDQAARQAIMNPNQQFKAGRRLSFFTAQTAGMKYLFMKLPSGRKIAYPQPELVEKMRHFRKKDGTFVRKKTEIICFRGQIPGTSHYGQTSTYGGKLVENATQAVAADIMAHGMLCAEARGFKLITTIHDQALAFEHPRLTITDFEEALTDLPKWASGLPLKADGKVTPYYVK